MHLTCNTRQLAQELRLLCKVVPAKSALPILSHVLLQADEHLYLTTSDLEISLQTACPAHVQASGTAALPALTLLGMVEHFTETDITIRRDNAHVFVTCGAFTSRLQTLPAEDFPQMPAVEGVVASLTVATLRRLIACTRYAVPDTGSKYALQGSLFSLTGPTVAMVSTDGKRLAAATARRGDGGPDLQIIIPAKTLDLLTTLPDDDSLTVTVGARHLFFQGARLAVSRMFDGKFPAYQRIIPSDSTKTAVVDRAALAAAIRRVGLLDEVITLTFSSDGLALTAASAQLGEAGERVAIAYTGDPLTVAVRGAYLLDFLDAASEPTITAALKDAKNPILLTEGEHHLAVIMTMRN